MTHVKYIKLRYPQDCIGIKKALIVIELNRSDSRIKKNGKRTNFFLNFGQADEHIIVWAHCEPQKKLSGGSLLLFCMNSVAGSYGVIEPASRCGLGKIMLLQSRCRLIAALN